MRIMAAVLGVLLMACSTSSDDNTGAADASTRDGATDCASLIDKKVGEACSTPASQVCFRQCRNDGCSCKNGRWACTTDFSCTPDAGPLVDGGEDDAADEDAGSGADAPVDAPLDAISDVQVDAPSDALGDAGADG